MEKGRSLFEVPRHRQRLSRACPVSRVNRIKMFHVKHFGTIDGREKRTLAAGICVVYRNFNALPAKCRPT
jgi:hypothetical protein